MKVVGEIKVARTSKRMEKVRGVVKEKLSSL